MKKTIIGSLAAATALLALGAAPAAATGSSISIGVTYLSNSGSSWYVNGDGSYYNAGDYTNVCLAIMRDPYSLSPVQTVKVECHISSGSYWFPTISTSLPLNGDGTCADYYTRVTAYRNGSQVANKNSNRQQWCS